MEVSGFNSGIKEAEKLTMVGELIRATEELEDTAAEARAKRREEAIKREELKEAAQVDESTLQRAAEETPPEIEEDGAAPVAPNIDQATPGQTGTVIDITA